MSEILLALVLLFSSAAAGESNKKLKIKAPIEGEQWVVSATQFKEVKVNGLPLKKAIFWEFSTITEIETLKSEVLLFLPKQFYFKIYPDSQIRMLNSTLQLIKGRIYIKMQAKQLALQVPGLFKFTSTVGDFLVSYDPKTKITDFEIVSQTQKIQIDSDDRDILANEGSKLTFTPEFVEGEMAYDFLLNDRKIPKLKMSQSKVAPGTLLGIQLWTLPTKKISDNTLKSKTDTKVESVTYICKGPKATLNACAFSIEGEYCVRYTCNLNGEWALRTQFIKNKLCPVVKVVKNCNWLGE